LAILKRLGTPVIIHQPSYSMVNRWIEAPYSSKDGVLGETLLDVIADEGIGCICFSPLAQGLLTSKYLNGVPAGSRATGSPSWRENMLSEQNLNNVRALNAIASDRGQTLAQMAVAWVLRQPAVTSALVGASSVAQLEDTVGSLNNLTFDEATLVKIDQYAQDGGVNIWSQSSFA